MIGGDPARVDSMVTHSSRTAAAIDAVFVGVAACMVQIRRDRELCVAASINLARICTEILDLLCLGIYLWLIGSNLVTRNFEIWI
jgi:hypothetical protein